MNETVFIITRSLYLVFLSDLNKIYSFVFTVYSPQSLHSTPPSSSPCTCTLSSFSLFPFFPFFPHHQLSTLIYFFFAFFHCQKRNNQPFILLIVCLLYDLLPLFLFISSSPLHLSIFFPCSLPKILFSFPFIYPPIFFPFLSSLKLSCTVILTFVLLTYFLSPLLFHSHPQNSIFLSNSTQPPTSCIYYTFISFPILNTFLSLSILLFSLFFFLPFPITFVSHKKNENHM